jgi:hypothetical protein
MLWLEVDGDIVGEVSLDPDGRLVTDFDVSDCVGGDEPDDHALGRSRGGWTTRLQPACEPGRKVLSLVVTGGQRGDSPQFATVPAGIRVPRPGGRRPVTRPDRVLADKPYSSKANRSYLRHAVSAARSRSRPTRPPTAATMAATVAGHRPSTRTSTNSVMPWSAASTCSSTTGPWPPATRNLAVRYEATVTISMIDLWLRRRNSTDETRPSRPCP